MDQQQDKVLRSIEELKDIKFFIPSYQRGYRWGEREVKALLQDIWDFAQKQSESSDFYCLQPVVLKKNEEQYRIIDGQQRLTTIFLIIKFLKNENYFKITYQSRPKSDEFLENIHDEFKEILQGEKLNIDFYHFYNAYKIIQEFFNNKSINQNTFLDILQCKCKVLWYEIDPKENENEVFTRLNIGKIPLVETENIKALFLSKSNKLDHDELRERAEFWYEAEKVARENGDFRYCVLNKIDTDEDVENEILKDDISRIEIYLKAIVYPQKDENYLFDYFYECYKNGILNDEWEKLESAINTLSSFASGKGSSKIDREIFHYIGFLIWSGENIYSLYKKWEENKNKELYSKRLLEMIRNKVSNDIHNLDQLSYEKDKQEIKNILLLFNLEYLICEESSNEYFKFNRFQLEQWSLEHIYAQNSKSIKEAIKGKDNERIIEWLKEILSYIDDEELKNKIKQSIEETNFGDELFEKIDENFENNYTLHAIQNLTLLDKASNSKIGNQIFSQKRMAIQELSKQNKFIPIATRKVFEKVFSKNKSNPDVFTKKDQEDYLKVIKEYLEKYKR